MAASSEKIHFMGDGNIGPRGGKLYVFHCPCRQDRRDSGMGVSDGRL